MLVKVFFVSIVLALAAAQEYYDRFDVRDAIEDAVNDYLDARDGLWESSELIERATLPSAGTCNDSPAGVFGCIPQTGGEPCGKCQPKTHGAFCLCDPPQPQAESHPAGTSQHGSVPGGSSIGGDSDAGSQHQQSPEAQSPSDTSKTTRIQGSCLRYGRASIGEKMCQYLHPGTNRWRLCLDRDVCPNPDNPIRCSCLVNKSDIDGSKDKKRPPNKDSEGKSNKKPKVVTPGPAHH